MKESNAGVGKLMLWAMGGLLTLNIAMVGMLWNSINQRMSEHTVSLTTLQIKVEMLNLRMTEATWVDSLTLRDIQALRGDLQHYLESRP